MTNLTTGAAQYGVQQSLCAALAKRLAWPGGTFANLL